MTDDALTARARELFHVQVAARLLELAEDLPGGPRDRWKVARAHDGMLVLWTADEETPLALLYAGHTLARYLLAAAPGALFTGEQAGPEGNP